MPNSQITVLLLLNRNILFVNKLIIKLQSDSELIEGIDVSSNNSQFSILNNRRNSFP
jgi:hypothetical protein